MIVRQLLWRNSEVLPRDGVEGSLGRRLSNDQVRHALDPEPADSCGPVGAPVMSWADRELMRSNREGR